MFSQSLPRQVSLWCSLILFFLPLLVLSQPTVSGKDGRVDPNLSVQPIRTGGNAVIYSFAETADGKVIVTGAFSAISGGTSAGVARLNADGSFDATFLGQTMSLVKRSFPLPDGKVLIYGDFTHYGGVARRSIARLNSDGSLDQTFTPNLDAGTADMVGVQPDGRILIVGSFTSVAGVSKKGIARLHPNGALDTTFDPGTGINRYIEKAVFQPDGKIIFTGAFSEYNGFGRYGIVRVNSDGSVDTSFNPVIPGQDQGGAPEFFDVELAADGSVYVAGDNFGGKIYRIGPNGLFDESYRTPLSVLGGRLWCMELQPDGKAIVGTQGSNLVRFNADGTKDMEYVVKVGQGTAIGIRGLLLLDDKLLVGGDFGHINGNFRGGIGRLDLAGVVDPGFVGFFGSLTTINAFFAFPDNSILVAGGFDFLSGSPNKYVAKIDSSGMVDGNYHLDPAVDNVIRAIASQPDGKILLGGDSGDDFSRAPSRGIWRLNSDGSLDPTLNARIAKLETVWAIAAQADGKILVGGHFTKINNVSRRALARLNPDGSLDASFLPDVGGLAVGKVVVQADGKILVAGDFTSFNGTPVGGLVRLNSDGTVDSSFNIGTGANRSVDAIAARSDGRIYVGGAFTSFNGVDRRHLLRLLPDGTIDPEFRQVWISGGVSAISEAPEGKLLVGGVIKSTVLGAAPREGVIRLLPNGSVDYSFDVKAVLRNGLGGEVFQVGIQPDGRVLVAGQFEKINGVSRPGFARLLKADRIIPANNDYDGDGKSDLAVYSASEGAWFWVASQSVTGWTINLGGQQDITVPADFDGDFLTDNVVFSPPTGTWTIYATSDATVKVVQFGGTGDVPLPGDYDGDGSADLCFWRPSEGNWYIKNSSNGSLQMIRWGQPGDEPIPADYDADGRLDLAVASKNGSRITWFVLSSNTGALLSDIYLGLPTDTVLVGDFSGDRRADIAVRRAPTVSDPGVFFARQLSGGRARSFTFATGRDLLVPGNFDGDSFADYNAVAASGSGLDWYIRSGFTGAVVGPTRFGVAGDRPAAASYKDQPVFSSSTADLAEARIPPSIQSPSIKVAPWRGSGSMPPVRKRVQRIY